MTKQYTIIILKEEKQKEEKRINSSFGYAHVEEFCPVYKNFSEPHEVIKYVSNMSGGDNKVHKIISMDISAEVTEHTIGFIEGKLGLILKE